jgi:hypothetical protein
MVRAQNSQAWKWPESSVWQESQLSRVRASSPAQTGHLLGAERGWSVTGCG